MLGQGGGTYFKIKNDDDPDFSILTGNEFSLIHVSMMRMCNKTDLGHLTIHKIYVGIVTHLFSQICNRVIALYKCQN